jgi:hypothetical protein
MLVKVDNLSGDALTWAVLKGLDVPVDDHNWDNKFIDAYSYEDNYSQFIDLFGISVVKKHHGWWCACIYDINDDEQYMMMSHTPGVAVLRCFVRSKLGLSVDVPDSLVKKYSLTAID